MTDTPQTTPYRLKGGETVTVRRHPLAGRKSECWEAEALVTDVPGYADRHAIGDTPVQAVERLDEYVSHLRWSENLDV